MGDNVRQIIRNIHWQFPDDKDWDGPCNIGLLSIQSPDMAASPRIFNWI
jgi:hypothetical protein